LSSSASKQVEGPFPFSTKLPSPPYPPPSPLQAFSPTRTVCVDGFPSDLFSGRWVVTLTLFKFPLYGRRTLPSSSCLPSRRVVSFPSAIHQRLPLLLISRSVLHLRCRRLFVTLWLSPPTACEAPSIFFLQILFAFPFPSPPPVCALPSPLLITFSLASVHVRSPLSASHIKIFGLSSTTALSANVPY